jgi:dTMP kinase
MAGRFITFEGPDGGGKSTQMRLGKTVVYTREPGGTRISEEIRKLLLNPANKEMSHKTEAFLYAAARAQHVDEFIRPAVNEGKIVLCDRFTDSTLAYQGYGRGIDIDFLRELNNAAIGGLVPHLTIILDIDPKEGIDRISKTRSLSPGGEKDRIEMEHINFHQRVRVGFHQLAKENPERYRLINAGRERLTVHREISQIVREVLAYENP